ncbi:MAG: CPBP family intramembrane metalloprotease [bacterium]|nr:CPBP family intramembrane metalloprotease [bacterium]
MHEQDNKALPLVILEGIILVLAIIWGLWRNLSWWNDLSRLELIIPGIALGIAISFLSWKAMQLAIRHGDKDLAWTLDELMLPIFGEQPISSCITLALVSGICEEAFFRGILLPEAGTLISCLIFGAMHTGDRRLIKSAVWAGLAGWLFAFIYMKTGSLALPIAVHAANNFTSFLILKKYKKSQAHLTEPG